MTFSSPNQFFFIFDRLNRGLAVAVSVNWTYSTFFCEQKLLSHWSVVWGWAVSERPGLCCFPFKHNKSPVSSWPLLDILVVSYTQNISSFFSQA